jgi:ribosomal protein S19E (S16A)
VRVIRKEGDIPMGFWGLMYGKKKSRSTYSKGLSAERKVKQRLESKGYVVRQSKGSRGPYDLYAMKSGRKLLVQVKSGTASASSSDLLTALSSART